MSQRGVPLSAWSHLLSYLQERHHTKVQYQLKSERISLAQVFSKMEQVVEVLGIEDYSVSQTTLDNVSRCLIQYMSDNDRNTYTH